MAKCVREIQIYKKNVLNYYLTQKQKTNLINCIKNKTKNLDYIAFCSYTKIINIRWSPISY